MASDQNLKKKYWRSINVTLIIVLQFCVIQLSKEAHESPKQGPNTS